MMENVLIIGRKGIPESTMAFAFEQDMTAFNAYANLKDAYTEDDLFIELTSRHNGTSEWFRNEPEEGGKYLVAVETPSDDDVYLTTLVFSNYRHEWANPEGWKVLGWRPLPVWEG